MSRADIELAETLRQAEGAPNTTGIEKWRNLVEMFFGQATRLKDEAFLWHKDAAGWQSLSYADAAQKVATMATALQALGVKPGDRVVLVSENRPEFCLWDLAIMAAHGITVPTYTTNTARDHGHILSDSGAAGVIVSNPKLAAPLAEAIRQSPDCRFLIGMEELSADVGPQASIHLMDTLLQQHKGDLAAISQAARMQRRDTACLIYTSGTGGTPRGVMQHHGAILHNISGCVDIITTDFASDGSRERFLSFLPLSHAYEHTAGQFLPIGLGGEIYYAEGLEKLASNIEETSPSIMVVVPRLFEVLRTRISKAIEKKGGMAVTLLNRALRISRKRAQGQSLSLGDRIANIAIERTVRKNARQRFGGRMKAMVSGGAPLNPEVGIFFDALGLTVLQGYGQTESGPVISCNRPATGIKMNSVGVPMRETDVRIADDGEIMVAGELVMHGYWNNPTDTARVLDSEGWLATGDIGMFDDDGHIVITDRKKDIIVNDKGDNVAPQRVEGMLVLEPEIAQAMVYGDRRPYLVGLVVPDAEYMLEWAAREGVEVAQLAQNTEFQRSLQAAVDRVNKQLSVVEKVRRVILATEPFTVENQQMTPSLKIRRHVLKEVYAPKLDALYK